MGFGLTLVLMTVIICVTTLFGIYMFCCESNHVGMFYNPKHEERIKELEKIVKELMHQK